MWCRRWFKAVFITLVVLLLVPAAGWVYVAGVDLSHGGGDPKARRIDLGWLANAAPPARGRILAVVSSTKRMLDGRGRAGYELTELSRAYWVFEAAGFTVDIASPRGGEAPSVVDEDLIDADYAFLNEPETRDKIHSTLPLDAVKATDYVAIYIVGGKGAMFDLHQNPLLSALIAEIYDAGGVVAAVCHGPAALLGVRLGDGRTLLSGRRVTGFSNAEERFLIKDPMSKLGFLLQDAISTEAEFVEGPMYLQHVVIDDRVLTGQNPWSTWALAEATVRALGVEPAARPRSAEERAIDLLALYVERGYGEAAAYKAANPALDNRLILLHALICGMRGEIGRGLQLMQLARA